MTTIKIYLRTHKEDSTQGYVWISFWINRERVNFTTGVRIDVKHWDPINSKIKKQAENASDKSLIIDTILARINSVFVRYRLKNKKLTRYTFTRAFNRPDDYDTFFDFIKDHQRNLNFKNEISTVYTHKYVINKIKEYAPNLHFDTILLSVISSCEEKIYYIVKNKIAFI